MNAIPTPTPLGHLPTEAGAYWFRRPMYSVYGPWAHWEVVFVAVQRSGAVVYGHTASEGMPRTLKPAHRTYPAQWGNRVSMEAMK